VPWLFSYGTLQQPQVQLAIFGRHLGGEPDELVDAEPALVRIVDPKVMAATGRTHHDNVRFGSANGAGRVPGTRFEVEDDDLARADDFEAPFEYRRVLTRLASGLEAWVYVHSERPT
jgi:hypothetical protein